MAKVDKRFQLLMTEEELELLKKEAEKEIYLREKCYVYLFEMKYIDPILTKD
ncbi:hypothetical protein LEP1GSC116_4563 [Leptospira interrogans serovar Icterohaemorrhagiae str. Verdun HP]|uniref:Uncharacterized protein n=1 Tax=Leptospira interrogans serovar Icterohaemorrhagiae str. Verdun HP TaxID=1049910 RepID=M6R2W0_LEPIR|nr:hypothetical protein LEP1GSC116_4563 [Leptospira interrogans serovar Icterohaemorrhagiae str. Verdun HP]